MIVEKLYTTAQAANELGISHDTLIHWIYRGKVPAFALPSKHGRKTDSYCITQAVLDNLRSSLVPVEERRTVRSSILPRKKSKVVIQSD